MTENFMRADISIPSRSYNETGCHVSVRRRDLQAPGLRSDFVAVRTARNAALILGLQGKGPRCKSNSTASGSKPPASPAILWSPWRATALEHRLFNEVKQLPGVHLESTPDEHARADRRRQGMEASHAQHVAAAQRLAGGSRRRRQGTPRLSLAHRRRHRRARLRSRQRNRLAFGSTCASAWTAAIIDDAEPSEWIDLSGFGLRFWPVGR